MTHIYSHGFEKHKMAAPQFYGIKYPFTNNGEENFFSDVNQSLKEKTRSLIMHVVFTPKGQKLRDPEFGTNLIKYIFEQDDNISEEGIKQEISNAISKHVPNCTLKNISILDSEEDENEIYVRIDYTIKRGMRTESDSVAVKL